MCIRWRISSGTDSHSIIISVNISLVPYCPLMPARCCCIFLLAGSLAKYEKSLWTGCKDQVKPASQEAEHRSIMALSALEFSKGESFANLTAMWRGCLLQEQGLFQQVETGDVVVSFGFQFIGVLGWKLQEVQDGLYTFCPLHLSSEDARNRITIIHVTSLGANGVEQWQGVPWDVCYSHKASV